MTSLNQASDRTKQTEEQQYTEEQYRTIQKQVPRLRPNTPPVCKNKRSYELITRRTASDTGKVFYECHICCKITNGYGNLNKHCRIHTGEKPYHCTVCESFDCRLKGASSKARRAKKAKRVKKAKLVKKSQTAKKVKLLLLVVH